VVAAMIIVAATCTRHLKSSMKENFGRRFVGAIACCFHDDIGLSKRLQHQTPPSVADTQDRWLWRSVSASICNIIMQFWLVLRSLAGRRPAAGLLPLCWQVLARQDTVNKLNIFGAPRYGFLARQDTDFWRAKIR